MHAGVRSGGDADESGRVGAGDESCEDRVDVAGRGNADESGRVGVGDVGGVGHDGDTGGEGRVVDDVPRDNSDEHLGEVLLELQDPLVHQASFFC